MTEHSEVYVRASAANESRLLQSPGQLHDFFLELRLNGLELARAWVCEINEATS